MDIEKALLKAIGEAAALEAQSPRVYMAKLEQETVDRATNLGKSYGKEWYEVAAIAMEVGIHFMEIEPDFAKDILNLDSDEDMPGNVDDAVESFVPGD